MSDNYAEELYWKGMSYRAGAGREGKEEREKIAFTCFQEAADLNYAEAQLALGEVIYTGFGCESNEEKALFWIQKAADQDYDKALHLLGYCYFDGILVNSDKIRAIDLWTDAFKRGYKSLRRNSWVCPDLIKAVDVNLSVTILDAIYGDVFSQYLLARFLEKGSFNMPVDKQRAVLWYTEAGNQGHSESQYQLGSLYCYGGKYEVGIGFGIERNFSKAIEWWKKAANQGHVKSISSLGNAFMEGGEGISMNKSKGVEYYMIAALMGDNDSKTRLGTAYSKGDGVEKNKSIAIFWWKKAAEQGNEMAQMHLEAVKRFGLD